ncbi:MULTISPECIES: hypothetical protein [unclassified Burkholderia]|uniref:hypothetical protein n=1 Tax=unclassified Burkholderia TaxID=2613784 RepID=UPI000F57465F|nr:MULTISPECIES: hypothetical protein [unclassified Burkholderia]
MDKKQREAWNARPIAVRVLEHCDSCGTLRDGVQVREASNYWPSYHLKLKSCASCFEAAKQKAAAEALNVVVC